MKKLWNFLTEDNIQYSVMALQAIIIGVVIFVAIAVRALIISGHLL